MQMQHFTTWQLNKVWLIVRRGGGVGLGAKKRDTTAMTGSPADAPSSRRLHKQQPGRRRIEGPLLMGRESTSR